MEIRDLVMKPVATSKEAEPVMRSLGLDSSNSDVLTTFSSAGQTEDRFGLAIDRAAAFVLANEDQVEHVLLLAGADQKPDVRVPAFRRFHLAIGQGQVRGLVAAAKEAGQGRGFFIVVVGDKPEADELAGGIGPEPENAAAHPGHGQPFHGNAGGLASVGQRFGKAPLAQSQLDIGPCGQRALFFQDVHVHDERFGFAEPGLVQGELEPAGQPQGMVLGGGLESEPDGDALRAAAYRSAGRLSWRPIAARPRH